jgi:hypothetical protein
MPVAGRIVSRVLLFLAFWLGPSLLYWWWFGRVLPFYPIFNLDLLLVGVVACLVPRLAIPSFLLAAGVAVLVAAAAIFHFHSPIDLLRYGGAPTLDFTALAIEHAGFAVLVGVVVLAGWVGTRAATRRQAILMLGVIAMLAIADQRQWSERLPPLSYGPINVVGSPGLALVTHHLLSPPGRIDKFYDRVRLADRTYEWAAAHPGRSIVFVVVESLGVPKDVGLAEWLDTALLPPAGYRMERGTAPFKGSTTAGELRQLCQLSGSYEHLRRDSSTEGCLPARLTQLGYATEGFHAFSGRMFQRTRWWPLVGLQRVNFLEELGPRLSAQRCGQAFRGLCDEEIVDMIGAASPLAGGRFSYLLTLNSHLPVDPIENRSMPNVVCEAHQAPGRACVLLGMHARLFNRLRDKLLSRPDRPLLVVVGDHAAPLSVPGERGVFVPDRVPYWILMPEP